MRFRGELSNIAAFTSLVQSIQTLSKRCVIKLTQESVQIICANEIDHGLGTQCWSQIEKSAIFNSYRIESNTNNEIYLEIVTDNLARAIKSTTGASSVALRLAKNGKFPVLQLEVKSASRSGSEFKIQQEILVRVLKKKDMDDLKEPLCPDPEVNIVLPPLLVLKTVADRLKLMSTKIVLSANMSGEFTLGIVADLVSVKTDWKGLEHPELDSSQANGTLAPTQPADPTVFKSVTLDATSLSKFLSCSKIATTTIACICPGHCAIFYVYVSGGVLTFFCPAIRLEAD